MINVMFFARLREQLQCEKMTINFQDVVASSQGEITVARLKAYLIELNPSWSVHFESTLLHAVNQEMVNDNVTIQPNDEVAFFPPVTGG